MPLFASGNFPSLTMFEVVVVAAAALFLALTPAAVVLSDARRRRRETARTLATAEPALLPGGRPLTDPPLAAPASWSDDESGWPTEAPVPSPDLGGEWSGEPAPELSLPEAEAAVAASAAPERSDAGQVFEPAMTVPAVPEAAVLAVEAIVPEPEWVYRGALSDVTPPTAMRAQVFQLLELRQARLTNWPPASVRANPAHRELWEEGERIAAKHDRQISSATLSWDRSLQAVAYAGVATDGEIYRLSFLLFEDMWPGDSEQACATATFEVSSLQGLLRSWVEPR